MKLTDKRLEQMVGKVKSLDLEEAINTLPEEERDGRSDAQIVRDELDWLIYSFNEGGCASCEALKEAGRLIYKTKGGKVFDGLLTSSQILHEEVKVREAKDLANEYNRLKRFKKRMEEYND